MGLAMMRLQSLIIARSGPCMLYNWDSPSHIVNLVYHMCEAAGRKWRKGGGETTKESKQR